MNENMLIITTLFTLFLLVTMSGVAAMRSAVRRMRREETELEIKELGPRFFYYPLHRLFFKNGNIEDIFFAFVCTQNIVRFLLSALFTLWTLLIASFSLTMALEFFAASALTLFFLGDYIPRLLGTYYPKACLRSFATVTSPFLMIVLPLTWLTSKGYKAGPHVMYLGVPHMEKAEAKREIIQMIENSAIDTSVGVVDRGLFESVVTFHDRVAKEIMVPRVDLCALPAETSIKEAAKTFDEEGFSRIPVFKQNIDNIVGILMYKDVLHAFLDPNQEKGLEQPVETIVKSAYYTHETKNISSLLQEFRAKQTHMAIVVDEYGGTEGIVTIEDILEEIVGEIADEYDEEEALFAPLKEGGWVVDPRMTINDLEAELDIKIPQEDDYDTLGGFIFHRAGSIPSKGFTIHHENFSIVILKSDEKSINQVKIVPLDEEK